jgi:hypothetical protein
MIAIIMFNKMMIQKREKKKNTPAFKLAGVGYVHSTLTYH